MGFRTDGYNAFLASMDTWPDAALGSKGHLTVSPHLSTLGTGKITMGNLSINSSYGCVLNKHTKNSAFYTKTSFYNYFHYRRTFL